VETVHEISEAVSKYLQMRWKGEEEKLHQFLNYSCSFIVTLICNTVLKDH